MPQTEPVCVCVCVCVMTCDVVCPQVRDGGFTSTAAANGDETRSIVKPPAVAHEGADSVHKEAFLFGQDDGAESDGEGE